MFHLDFQSAIVLVYIRHNSLLPTTQHPGANNISVSNNNTSNNTKLFLFSCNEVPDTTAVERDQMTSEPGFFGSNEIFTEVLVGGGGEYRRTIIII